MGAIHMTGKSKLGNPVISVLARAYNPKLVEDNIQIVYFFVFYIDALCRMAEQAGQETFFGIFDLEGFSTSNFSLSQIKMVISILQNHYPERLGGIFVINARTLVSFSLQKANPPTHSLGVYCGMEANQTPAGRSHSQQD